MCTVPLPPGGYPIAVNKYIISYIMDARDSSETWASVYQTTWRLILEQNYLRSHCREKTSQLCSLRLHYDIETE